MVADQDWVELSEAIRQLRVQLSDARAMAVGQDVTFTVGVVEVELAVEAHREVGAGGGIRFGVVSLEGKGGVSSGSTNRVRVQLQPHHLGVDLEVGGHVDQPPLR